MRPDPGRAAPWRPATRVAVGLATFLAFLLMLRYHDVYWYPPDEGNYAHVAERLTQGEVLHKDVQDVHPGYINFVHAAAFKLFGERLVSLRYPLALLTVLQAGLVAWVLARRGMVVAVAGGVLSVATGVLLFLNPSANWYGLGLTICLVALAANPPRGAGSSAVLTGIVVGVALMFRQLTGVVLGVAAVTWLLTAMDNGPAIAQSSPRVARGVLAVAVTGTAAYTLWATDAVGWILFGAGPVALGLVAIFGTALPNRIAIGRLCRFVVGVSIGLTPMLVYVAVTRTWAGFVDNTILAAIALPDMDPFLQRSYAAYLVLAVLAIATLQPVKVLAGAYWLLVVSAPLVLAWCALKRVRTHSLAEVNGGALIALFAGLLMAHLPSPLYIGAAAPAVLLGLLLAARPRPIVAAVAAALAVVEVVGWQVGYSRAIQWLWGNQPAFEVVEAPGRVGLRVSKGGWAEHERLIAHIRSRSSDEDAIFVLPSHAELYFLAERRNPTPFFSFAQGIRSKEGLDSLLGKFDSAPPRLVVVNPTDPLFVPFAGEVIRWVARKAIRVDRVGRMWVFEIDPPHLGLPE